MRHLRKDDGVLTVEGAFVLSLFILAMTSWMLLVERLNTEAMLQRALDQAALCVADHLSMVHTLQGAEDNLNAFVQVLQENQSEPKMESFVEEVVPDMATSLDAQEQVNHFFSGGTGLPSEIQKQHVSSEVDDARDELTLKWEVEMSLPGVLRPLGSLHVVKNTTVGIWVLTDDPILGLCGKEDERDQHVGESSVWLKPPLTRGRELVAWRRETAGARRVKSGQVFDLYHDVGELEAIVSLNLFSSTYASGNGMDPKNYTLKRQNIVTTIESKVKDVLEALEKRPTLEMEDGERLATAKRTLTLSVILPEEAKEFEAEMGQWGREIEAQYGVSIRYFYLEKALVKSHEQSGDADRRR